MTLVCGYSSKRLGALKCPFSCINKYNHKQSSMNNFYTYAYLRQDGTPYYIGKGKGKRLYSTNRCFTPPKDKKRIIYLKKDLIETEAFKHEIYMISVFGRKDLETGILHNRTNGGEGASGAVRSLEFRKNLSKYYEGRKFTQHTIEKIRESNKRAKEGCRGKFRIRFNDGRELIISGIKEWCKRNNYNYTCISRLRSGEYKKHKDIVTVEKLDFTP